MRAYILACCLIVSASAAYAPRLRRDVSELQSPAYNYLPPATKLALPEPAPEAASEPEAIVAEVAEAPTSAPPSAVLSADGYEYRTVRRLKFRKQRDVSHLTPHYLPPQNEYLPPADIVAAAPEDEDADTEVVDAPAAPKVANEYLPPVEEEATSTEAPVAAAPETEAPAAAVNAAPEAVEEPEAPQDTAVLAEDGYHYKQPEEVPELKSALEEEAAPAPAAAEYLPPTKENESVEVVEGPEETAVLAADGYHYRAVKRIRF